MDIIKKKISLYESESLKKSPFPSLSFYPRFAAVLISECFKASKKIYTGEDWAFSSARVLKTLEAVGVHFSIRGLENINIPDGPVVFIANHMSTLEALILPCLIQPRKDVTFVVKEKLVSYPIFKHILISRDPIRVERKNPREDLATVLKEGVKRLNEGRSIIVFPQSTRSLIVDPKLFNSIGVKLAKRADAQVIPIALKTDAWGAGSIIKELGRIDTKKPVNILFGQPLKIKNKGKEEQEEIFNFIKNHVDEWQNLKPQLA